MSTLSQVSACDRQTMCFTLSTNSPFLSLDLQGTPLCLSHAARVVAFTLPSWKFTIGLMKTTLFALISFGRERKNIQTSEREREMFYLTTHSTHFIYGYMASDMVKDHSDSEKGNPLPPHRLLLSISSKGSFICTIPQTG